MKLHFLSSLVLCVLLWAMLAGGVPITPDQAGNAATNFIVKYYPPPPNAVVRTVTPFGMSHLAIQQVEAWTVSGHTIGFIADLSPSGYVLLGADDEVPPVKLHSDEGAFAQLPPGFARVIQLELTEDLSTLAAMKMAQTPVNPAYHRQWQALLDPKAFPSEQKGLGPAGPNNILLTTSWNQNDPYNYYCPPGTLGPGGRAWAGCTACAVAQILRYCQEPDAVAQDHVYTDGKGFCTGTHSISDAGMGAYSWTNMPNAINTSSPLAQKQAIGQLMYHAGVALESNYETNGTSAHPGDVPGVFSDFFTYACGGLEDKSSFTGPQWHAKIAGDIDAYRPIFYAMYEWDGGETNGHAVVCDGYRSTNELHLNLGWSGSGNAWYNQDSVSTNGYTWVIFRAVFGITPPFIYVDRSFSGTRTNGALATPFTTVEDGYRAARNPTTIRIATGNYPESFTMSQAVRLEARNGIVRIGTQ